MISRYDAWLATTMYGPESGKFSFPFTITGTRHTISKNFDQIFRHVKPYLNPLSNCTANKNIGAKMRSDMANTIAK